MDIWMDINIKYQKNSNVIHQIIILIIQKIYYNWIDAFIIQYHRSNLLEKRTLEHTSM